MPEHNIDHITPAIEHQARTLASRPHAIPGSGWATRFDLIPGDDTVYEILLATVGPRHWVILLNHGGPHTWELPAHLLTADLSTHPISPDQVRQGLHQDPYVSTVLAHFLTHIYRTPR